ncbi:MAG: hypothetical protein H0U57_01415 [Tatlockia sp.]|nr:hypothetical protein [Tatlockia sp.]
MAFDYYVSNSQGIKSYYRAGFHPQTDVFEFYSSIGNIAWQKKELKGKEFNLTGCVYVFRESNATLTILYNGSSLLLNNTLSLKKIVIKELPSALLDIELKEMDRLIEEMENSLCSPQPILPKNEIKPSLNKPVKQSTPIRPQYYPLENQEEPSKDCLAISMQVLGLFIGALGIAAVAFAFIALNGLTMGTFFLVAGVGCAALLAGIGLFSGGLYRSCNSATPEPDNQLFLNI